MLSKPAIFAAGIALVRGDALATGDGTGWDSGTHKTWGCARCIRQGYNWVSQDYGDGTLTGSDPTGFCCDGAITDGSCDASIEDGGALAAGWRQSSDMGQALALSQCPSRSDVCGTALQQFANTEADQVTITIDAATTNMDQDDQCVYTIEATCGAPGFTIDSTSTLGDADFAVFYLDFLNSGDAGATVDEAGNAYTVTDTQVADATPIALDGDQTGHLPNDPHPFMYTPAEGAAGVNDFVVPGRFAGTWFKQYNDEVEDFNTAAAAYDDHKTAWDEYNAWVITWASADEWTKAWGYLTGQGVVSDPGLPAWPPRPPAYGGPAVGTGTNDLTYTTGFGKPTAGMISVSGGGRSFGVLGEGYAESDYTGAHAADTMKEARYGVKLPAEDPDACTKSFSKYVVIPKQALSANSLVLKAGALPWSTHYAFEALAQPAEVTQLTQEELGLA